MFGQSFLVKKGVEIFCRKVLDMDKTQAKVIGTVVGVGVAVLTSDVAGTALSAAAEAASDRT